MLRLRSLVVVLTILVGGCAGEERPVPVTGKVTYRGEPLPSAVVVLLPETPGVVPASGVTDSDGRFELMTKLPGDGAYVGKYRVTITARAAPKAPVQLSARPGPPGAPLIPQKYFSADTSGLTAEVPRGGSTIEFALTD